MRSREVVRTFHNTILFLFVAAWPCITSASDRLYNCQFAGAELTKVADLDGTSVYLPGYWSINRIDYRDGANVYATCQEGWYGPGPAGSDFWKDLQEFASTHEDGDYLAYGAADGSYLFFSVLDHGLNLARIHGVASADSYYSSNTPDRAIDGDYSTFWNAPSQGTVEAPHWLIIDFQQVFPVDKIVLVGQVYRSGLPWWGYTNSYNLSISIDKVAWTLIGSGTLTEHTDPREYTATYSLTEKQARFVKYEVVGGTHWAYLNEIEVYGGEPQPPVPSAEQMLRPVDGEIAKSWHAFRGYYWTRDYRGDEPKLGTRVFVEGFHKFIKQGTVAKGGSVIQYSRYQVFHEGIDVLAGKGTPVYAAASGTIRYIASKYVEPGNPANDNSPAGRWILIRHDEVTKLDGSLAESISSRYLHLETIDDWILDELRQEGKDPMTFKGWVNIQVSRGQKIGTVGNTGCRAQPPHLHFEVREGDDLTHLPYNTLPLNPCEFAKYTGHVVPPEQSRQFGTSAFCPVDLVVTDPDGLVITKTVTQPPMPGQYIEVKGSIDEDEPREVPQDGVILYEPKVGDYLITVVLEEAAQPTDTYSLEVTCGDTTLILAESVPISSIPSQPYLVERTETEITPIFPATVDFDPDTLNLVAPVKFVTVYIEMAGGLDARQINVTSIKLNDSIHALLKPTAIGDHDGNGRADLMVKFDGQGVFQLLAAGQRTIEISGQLADGTRFAGRDTIRVLDGNQAQAPKENTPIVESQPTGESPVSRVPTVSAGDDIDVFSVDLSSTVIHGTGRDADGDPLNYRWLEGDMVLLGWLGIGSDGMGDLDMGSLDNLTVGRHTLVLEVNDGKQTSSDSMVLAIRNTPPRVQATPDSQVIEPGVDPVILAGEVSDFDGDTLEYEWIKDRKILNSGTIETPRGGGFIRLPELTIPPGGALFPSGRHQVEVRVHDRTNEPVSAFVTVEVVGI